MKCKFALTDLEKSYQISQRYIFILKILYKRNTSAELHGWYDSDYAGDVDIRICTFGYVFMLG